MSALFGITIDDMVKGDANVMAQAIARDRNRLLVVGPKSSEDDSRAGDAAGDGSRNGPEEEDAAASITLTMPEPQGNEVFGNYERIEASHAGVQEFRLVRTFALLSMSNYRIENRAGEVVGTIHRGRALFDPVYQLRVPGFERVQVKREWKPADFRYMYTIEGEGVGVDGAVLGDEFSIWRHEERIATVRALRGVGRPVYGIELEDGDARPLAFGVAMMFLMLRDYDRCWVRTSR